MKRCLPRCGEAIYASRHLPFKYDSTILLAGHETSATSLCWVLLEVARNKDVQDRLREEIRATEKEIIARGDTDFTATDFENMQYMGAVLKVSPILADPWS